MISEQDWSAIEQHYRESEPYTYAIIDNILTPEICTLVRERILNNWGWQYMNWQAKELFIRDFELPEAAMIATEIKERLPNLLGKLELVQHIAFWHQKNAGLYAHSDTGAVSLNIWLTPDEFNLDPKTGGLILYDVKRTDNMNIHEFNAAPYSTDYFRANTRGGQVKIPYRYNRATLFDARTFHASDRITFLNNGSESTRINFALLFDDPTTFRQRFAFYNSNRAKPKPYPQVV